MKTYRYKNFAYQFYQGRLYRLDLIKRIPYPCAGCEAIGEMCDVEPPICYFAASCWQDITDEVKANLGVKWWIRLEKTTHVARVRFRFCADAELLSQKKMLWIKIVMKSVNYATTAETENVRTAESIGIAGGVFNMIQAVISSRINVIPTTCNI